LTARPDGVTQRTLPKLLDARASTSPDKVALVDEAGSLTYQELAQEARRYAAGLAALGVERGDPVLLMLDNHLDFVRTWFGANFAGAVQVPVNTAYKGVMLAHLLRDSGAKVIVIESHYAARLESLGEVAAQLRHVVVRGSVDPGPRVGASVHGFGVLSAEGGLMVDVDAWEPMGYLYTSGTTGPSKGVVTSHCQAYTYSLTHWVEAEDRIMVNLPLFHIGGQWAGVLTALVAEGSAAIMPRFHASTFWVDAARNECTQTLLIGAMATFLMKQPSAPSDRGHTMRRMGVAPVIPDIREFEDRFGVVTGSAYGLTECATPIVTPYGRTAPNVSGWLRPGFEARIVDDHDLEVPTGTVGELVLRTSEPWTAMSGYLGRPEATSAVWINQWLHTGDNMYVDEEGRFYFVDRKKDAMRVRGENVSSYEVEAAINQFPDVAESACVAVASDATEDDILAFVVMRPGATAEPEALMRFLVDRLPYFMVPRYLDFLDALPRTPTERVQKDELRRIGISATCWDRQRAGFVVTREPAR